MIFSLTTSIFLIVLTTVILHTLMGCIIVPMRGSLSIDGTGHSVVFGIILGFMIGKSLNSIWLFFGAIISSILMNFLINFFNKNKEISYDASIGLSFSLLFSIGILLISVYARNIHLDLDMILLGNVEYAIYDTVNIFGNSVPKILLITNFSILIVLFFLYFFWKKIIYFLFDKDYSEFRGTNKKIFEIIFNIFCSSVIVASFNVMGALILVGIATSHFAFSWENSKNFLIFIKKSLLINVLISIFAVYFSIIYDLPIASSVSFFLTFFGIIKIIFFNK